MLKGLGIIPCDSVRGIVCYTSLRPKILGQAVLNLTTLTLSDRSFEVATALKKGTYGLFMVMASVASPHSGDPNSERSATGSYL